MSWIDSDILYIMVHHGKVCVWIYPYIHTRPSVWVLVITVSQSHVRFLRGSVLSTESIFWILQVLTSFYTKMHLASRSGQLFLKFFLI